MRRYDDNGDDLLLRTVDVQIEMQVFACLRILHLTIEEKAVFSNTSVLVKPIAYYRSKSSLCPQEVINER